MTTGSKWKQIHVKREGHTSLEYRSKLHVKREGHTSLEYRSKLHVIMNRTLHEMGS